MKSRMLQRKELGRHDFYGECAPGGTEPGHNTFSVGIFKWVPKASGKGLKRSKVIYRIKGLSNDPEPVFDKAEKICDELDEA